MNPIALGERKPPTKGHKAAIWESMLGTVCAADREGNERYFDYDYDAAIEFADLDGCDLRTARFNKAVRGHGVKPTIRRSENSPTGAMTFPAGPRRGQLVLWRKARA